MSQTFTKQLTPELIAQMRRIVDAWERGEVPEGKTPIARLSPFEKRVLDIVEREGTRTVAELAAELQSNPSNVGRAMKQVAATGTIVCVLEPFGGTVRWRAYSPDRVALDLSPRQQQPEPRRN